MFGMIQRSEQLRLALKPGEPLSVVCELVGQNFYRHVPGEVRVLGAIHFTHPALTELLRNAAVRE